MHECFYSSLKLFKKCGINISQFEKKFNVYFKSELFLMEFFRFPLSVVMITFTCFCVKGLSESHGKKDKQTSEQVLLKSTFKKLIIFLTSYTLILI